MKELSFSERVRTIAIQESKRYKEVYVDYEYLILADNLKEKFYIITGTKENYLHLIGIHTTLTPFTFFDKCMLEELRTEDFDFVHNGTELKGTVRRKIKVLSNMNKLIYQRKLYVQEQFKKNRVLCSLGTSDNVCTVGFIKTSRRLEARAFPKTLMRGNELKDMKEVELLLRREKGMDLFNRILIGNKEIVRRHFEELKNVITVNLFVTHTKMRKDGNKRILHTVKIPMCFRVGNYSAKLKKIKLINRMR